MTTIKRIALVLVIIGAINWGLIGLFRFDLVAAIFGGQTAGLSRVIYTLVGLSGLVSMAIYWDMVREEDMDPIIDENKLGYSTEFSEEIDISDPEERDDLF